MVCTKCGNTLPEGSKFCPFCGAMQAAANAGQAPENTESMITEAAEAAAAKYETAGSFADSSAAMFAVSKPEAAADRQTVYAQESADAVTAAAEAETQSPSPAEIESKAQSPAPAEPEKPAPSRKEKHSKGKAADKAAKPRKKRRKWPLVLIIILLLAGAGGYYVYDNLPSTQAGKHVKAAEEFFQAKDLDGAVKELKTAAELVPDRTLQYEDKIAEYYSSFFEPIMAEKRYTDAIALLEKEKADLASRKDVIDAQITGIYEGWAQEVLDGADFAQIVSMNQYLKDKSMSTASDKLKEISTRFEDFITEYRLNDNFASFTAKVRERINAGDWASVYSMMRSDLFTATGEYRNIITTVAVDQTRYLPLLTEPSGGKQFGLYYSGNYYYLYYGEYAEGKRSGKGTWITVINKTDDESWLNYHADCSWEDDLPSGEFTEYTEIKLPAAEAAETRRVQGTVKQGMYEGSIHYFYGDYPEMNAVFNGGHPKVISNKDPNGKSAFVIAMSEDETAWLSSTEGVNGLHGIRGFR